MVHNSAFKLILLTVQKNTINFFLQDKFERTPIGRFLKWALTIGKYIIILTQLIVIATFLFRFKLDKNLEVLNENINQNQKFIIASQDLEYKTRIVQDQLETLKMINKDQVLISQTIEILSQITPLEVKLETVNLSQKSINIEGSALSEIGLATLINGLQNQPYFSNINVNSVSTGGPKNPALTFEISFKPIVSLEGKK